MIYNVGDVFSGFLFILTHISLDLLSLGSEEAYIGWGGKLISHLMASCVRNICTKKYQNLIRGFLVTVENVWDVFLGHSVYPGIFCFYKKSELMLMRHARAYGSFCSQVILVYLHPFHCNSCFCN